MEETGIRVAAVVGCGLAVIAGLGYMAHTALGCLLQMEVPRPWMVYVGLAGVMQFLAVWTTWGPEQTQSSASSASSGRL